LGDQLTERAEDGRRVSPIVARRQLNRRFVQSRREAGFASRELAAEALGWSPRKQALLESDEQALPVKDLDVILRTFKVPEDEWPGWQQLAGLARDRGWWDEYEQADLPREGKRFVGYEWGARRIRSFDGSIMPALLQIPGYTVAALDAGLAARPPEQVRRLLAVRRQRQRALSEPDPLQYHAILDEAALRRPGGSADTMRAQLDHIIDLTTLRPNITVQIVPFSVGLYVGLSGNFVIMDFDRRDDEPGIVHAEPGFDSSVYVEERSELYLYSRVFQRMAELALSPAESLDLMASVARDPGPA
jgi:hypothetical protein